MCIATAMSAVYTSLIYSLAKKKAGPTAVGPAL